MLRVEDLDAGRVRPGVMESQLADLAWLGLDWDEGPYLQSERQELYEAGLRRLGERGLLYPCFCSRREIAAAASAPHGPDEEGPAYPGTCRALSPGESVEREGERGTPALRFRVSPGEVRFHDLLQGDVSFRPADEVGDFVVRRKDGVAAYQLAVVVDDAAMGITHVLRGADLLPSTARQLLLYDALGLRPPVWTHVPLLLGADGERLAKRHGSVSLRELRERGVPARKVVGWLASSCGLAAPGEEITAAELVPRFELRRLPRKPQRLPPLPWS